MDQPQAVLPFQCYRSLDDYTAPFDHHSGEAQDRRTPLSESSGNAQPYHIAALALCQNSQLNLRPSNPHSIPTPPLFHIQGTISSYGTSLRNKRTLHREVPVTDHQLFCITHDLNPLYEWPHFSQYRKRVTQKQLENKQAPWPDWAENAFLMGMSDSLTFISSV